MLETTLLAVFITGLFGGLHCAGMCGGIVSALSFRPPVAKIKFNSGYAFANSTLSGGSASNISTCSTTCRCTASQRWVTQLLYNSGRLTTYAILGAGAGAVGSVSRWMSIALPVQQLAFLITNVLLILMGLYLGGVKRIGQSFEKLGGELWRHLYPHALNRLKAPGAASAVLAGALWGLVPCGMVYGVLVAALFSGSALDGAGLMLAFGVGTLPSLLALGTAGTWIKTKSKQIRFRRGAGGLIVLFGVIGLLRLDAAENLPLIGQLCVHLPGLTPAGITQ